MCFTIYNSQNYTTSFVPDSTTKTTANPINVAVVGLGFMGVTHLRAYLENPAARIVAVCGNRRLPVNGVLAGVAGNIQKSEDIPLGKHVKVYRELEELLADPEIELVDICTPTALHPAQTIAALKAGKHVLCEKPLARTAAAAREILSVAEKSHSLLMPAMCMRFWPGWAWLKQGVTQLAYGRVLAANFRRMTAMPAWSASGTYAADSGGALYDLHIHDTDFVNFLFGLPQSVFSTGVVAADGAVNHVVTQYHYASGPAVSAEGSFLLAAGFNMGYTLHCERATIDFDLSRGAAALQITESGQATRALPLDGPDGYGAEIRYILECVAARRAPQVVTAHDALTALQICEAEEQSLRTGAVVNL